jgi:dTDP-4-amino-4,6-dideoxygalactose transaminase
MITVPLSNLTHEYQCLKNEIDFAISQVLNSGHFILGGHVEKFEDEFAKYVGADYAVGVGNGLDAIEIGLRVLGVGVGDEVLVPEHTYIATWLAVSKCGATPIPIPTEINSYNIDSSKILTAVNKNTKVIIPVHLYGHPVDLDPIFQIAKKCGLKVLEDAAQAHGALYKNRRIGSGGDMVAWSFYPTKNLGAFGDGGAISTSNLEYAEKARLLGNYGSKEKYKHIIQGGNSRLDEMQAAILSVKLKKLDEWNAQRSLNASFYMENIDSKKIILPTISPETKPVWHQFVVWHAERDVLQENLRKCGIQSMVHYPTPPGLQDCYDHTKYFTSTRACEISKSVLSIPIGPHLNQNMIEHVAESINKYA